MGATSQGRRQDRCPDFEAILGLHEGELAEAESGRVRAHLGSGCPRCLGVLEEVRLVTGLLASAGEMLRTPPEGARRKVLETGRALLRERGERTLPVRMFLLERVSARLPAGFRGAGAARGVEEYVHRTAPVGIRVQVRPDFGGRRRVRGSVYPVSEPGPLLESVLLRDEGGREYPAELLPRGGFALEGLPEGSYTLVLRFHDHSLVFPGLRAGTRAGR